MKLDFKNLIASLINIGIFLLTFLVLWFNSELVQITTFLGFALILIILFFINLGAIIGNIIYMSLTFKKSKFLSLIPLAINLGLASIILLFPFTISKVKLEHFMFEEKRIDIINAFANDLEKEVPSYLSINKTIETKEYSDGNYIVGFYVYEGMMSSYALIYYTSIDDPKLIENGVLNDILNIEKIDDNWYYVVLE